MNNTANNTMERTDAALAMLIQRRDELQNQRERVDAELSTIEAMLAVPDAQDRLERLRSSDVLGQMFGMKFGDLATEPVWKVAIYILREQGSPLELEDLAAKILETGKNFGGEDPGRSLAAHISKHPEHMKQMGGKAYLIEWL